MKEKQRGNSFKTTDRAHRNLSEKLRREGIKKPVVLASFYFDVFYVESLKLKKESVVLRKLCDDAPGCFAKWRKTQKALEMLDWDELKLANGKIRVRYKAGPALIPYINKLTTTNEPLATKADVRRVKDDVQDLRAEVHSLRNAMGALIDKIDPPNSEDKMIFYTKNPASLASRLS
jgi:hypothetical protein